MPLDRRGSAGGLVAGPGDALGQSEAFLAFQETLSRVAPVNRPVLLIGERGTGKELAAARLHYLSRRWQGPLVTLNCAALSPALIEAELFGHEKGAFTGALQRRGGRFEAAVAGTLFLDEIGNIPLEVQEKILRVVEYNTFERVGSSEPVEVDVRIVAATNVRLDQRVAQGRFKADLMDRLSFEVLFVPPLRERGSDILLLADHFAARMAYELGREEIPRFSRRAVAALQAYHWPGNVRELKNVVERAVYRSDSPLIAEVTFDPFRSPFAAEPPPANKRSSLATGCETAASDSAGSGSFEQAVREYKLKLLKAALVGAHYNQKKAAAELGLTYDQFRGLYRRYRDQLD